MLAALFVGTIGLVLLGSAFGEEPDPRVTLRKLLAGESIIGSGRGRNLTPAELAAAAGTTYTDPSEAPPGFTFATDAATGQEIMVPLPDWMTRRTTRPTETERLGRATIE